MRNAIADSNRIPVSRSISVSHRPQRQTPHEQKGAHNMSAVRWLLLFAGLQSALPQLLPEDERPAAKAHRGRVEILYCMS